MSPRQLLTALVLCSMLFSFSSAAQNIMNNPDFEKIENNKPLQWSTKTWAGSANFKISNEGRNGSKCLVISSEKGADASWQTFVKVKPFSKYKLAGWIKTESLEPTSGQGALINIHNMQEIKTKAVKGDAGWT